MAEVEFLPVVPGSNRYRPIFSGSALLLARAMPRFAMKVQKLMFGSFVENFPVSDLKQRVHVEHLKSVVFDSDLPIDILTLSA